MIPSTIRIYWFTFFLVELLLAAFVYGLYQIDLTQQQAALSSSARTSLSKDVTQFSVAFHGIRANLEFLSHGPRLGAFLNGAADLRGPIEEVFSIFSKSQQIFDQVRVLGIDGMEIIRINLVSGTPQVVPQAELQDKSDRDYFQAAQKLKDGAIGVSAFDLNREHGQVEQPPKPVIRFFAPVIVSGVRKGYVILNYLGGNLLEDLGSDAFDSHRWLINAEGNYLKGGIPPADFAWILGSPRSFHQEYPSVWEQIRGKPDGMVRVPAGNFYFHRVSSKSLATSDSINSDSPTDSTSDLYFILYLDQGHLNRASRDNVLRSRLLPLFGFMSFLSLVSTIGLTRAESIRQQQQQEISRTVAMLQKSNADLEHFAFIASHDLQSPLRAISGLSDWLTEDPANTFSDDGKTYLAMLRGRVERMQRLLDDLLAYSRIGREEDQVREVDLAELIQEIIDLNPPPPGFRVIPPAGAPRFITYQIPLQMSLRNLINNAIKHHHQPDQGEIRILCELTGNWAQIDVIDNGPGIALKYQKKVFEMFQTLRPRDQVEGSGMGLAIVKKAAEHTGGGVTLLSDEGKGCTFRLRFPILSGRSNTTPDT